MQKTYKNSTLIQGLLIAPIPLLMCVFIYIFITDYPLANNYESGSHFQFLITMIIASYLIFILIISPIIFVVLYLLNTKQKLHLVSISILAYGSALLISILGDYFKNSHLPHQFSELIALFILNPFLIPTMITALTFWLFLKFQKST